MVRYGHAWYHIIGGIWGGVMIIIGRHGEIWPCMVSYHIISYHIISQHSAGAHRHKVNQSHSRMKQELHEENRKILKKIWKS